MHKDAYGGSLSVVNMLITAGSEIDTKALHEAMKNGWHLYVVKIHLENISKTSEILIRRMRMGKCH
jgi:hypothetical protein